MEGEEDELGLPLPLLEVESILLPTTTQLLVLDWVLRSMLLLLQVQSKEVRTPELRELSPS